MRKYNVCLNTCRLQSPLDYSWWDSYRTGFKVASTYTFMMSQNPVLSKQSQLDGKLCLAIHPNPLGIF